MGYEVKTYNLVFFRPYVKMPFFFADSECTVYLYGVGISGNSNLTPGILFSFLMIMFLAIWYLNDLFSFEYGNSFFLYEMFSKPRNDKILFIMGVGFCNNSSNIISNNWFLGNIRK